MPKPSNSNVKLYDIIYADPPWPEPNRSGSKQTSGRNEPLYQTMSYNDIFNMKVSEICKDDCMLFLWVPWYRLEKGMETMVRWGFDYSTGIPWVKRTVSGKIKLNFGRYAMPCSEPLLIGKKGKANFPSKPEAGIFESVAGKHSSKPQVVRDWINRCFTGAKIELFAREKHDGWDSWGNEVEHDVSITTRLGLQDAKSR